MMLRLVDLAERCIATLGRWAGYLNLVLIVLVVTDIMLRWTLSLTAAWVIELEWHLFSLIFLLGIPYALQADRHVRVDLFYDRFKAADKRLVNLIGTALFLLPWAAVLLLTSWRYAAESWAAGEGSPNPNGIPYYFPIKAVVPLAAALLLVQGVALMVRTYRRSSLPT